MAIPLTLYFITLTRLNTFTNVYTTIIMKVNQLQFNYILYNYNIRDNNIIINSSYIDRLGCQRMIRCKLRILLILLFVAKVPANAKIHIYDSLYIDDEPPYMNSMSVCNCIRNFRSVTTNEITCTSRIICHSNSTLPPPR